MRPRLPASRQHCRMSISTRAPIRSKAWPSLNPIWRSSEGGRPMPVDVEVMDLVTRLKAAEEAFVLATVVRTVSVTAAKAGAKAVIRPDGTIAAGWIGGGCARGAVLKAAREALADGEPRMVSVQPGDLLNEVGVKTDGDRDRIRFAKNMGPGQGTIDIFVRTVL